MPFAGPCPQRDYSVGFRVAAFTGDQLAKLLPLIGKYPPRVPSYFMATYYMFFPFLTCEVKSGTVGLVTLRTGRTPTA